MNAYYVFLGNNLVSWSCWKEKVVVRSRVEVEYRALAFLVAEIKCIKSLLCELGLVLNQLPLAYCDNVNVKYLCENPIMHHRIKHIDIDYHFISPPKI